MRNHAVRQHKQRLDAVFEKISILTSDPEMGSHWARYLCVLVSGFLEASVRSVLHEYVKKRSSDEVVRYVEGRLRGFQNPNMQRILDLSGGFNPVWKEKLESATKGEMKLAVDSIVANKNKIAHGESVEITYSRVKSYYGNIVAQVDLLEEQCGS